MKELIARLQEGINDEIELQNNPSARSWKLQQGILLSVNEAKEIVKVLEGKVTFKIEGKDLSAIVTSKIPYNKKGFYGESSSQCCDDDNYVAPEDEIEDFINENR